MSKLVTIYGGAGFVGRHIARSFAAQGWRVRIAVRRPNDALFVRTYGVPGQVEPVACNIRDEASVRAAMAGALSVVNCVGILNGLGKNGFGPVQAEGAGRIARLAAQEGAAHLVHLSALGADPEAASAYARTKGEGEALVLSAFPGAVILRPSVIFGSEDQFFNRFAAMAMMCGPVLPIAGGSCRFQPVHVDDVAAAAVLGAQGLAPAGIYELGGPEIASLRALVARMLQVIQRRRVILSLPFIAARPLAGAFDLVQALSGGLIENRLLTRDQLRSLEQDKIVSPGARTLADLGITPTAMEAVLPEYLWRYRPAGQYAAIKQSAQNLTRH